MATKKRTKQTKPNGRMRDADYRQLADFRYALRMFLEFSSSAARKAGLTPLQHQALLTIKGLSISGKVSIGDIAKQLLSRHHSTVELLDRLGDAGLVQRCFDEGDKRRVNIVLSDQAERILEVLSEAHINELRRLRPIFSAVLRLSPVDD